MPTVDRFWSKVNRPQEADACHLWTGKTERSGHGRFSLTPTTAVYAHRYAYELTYGLIPDAMLVLHRCDNPPCVNPDHLFLGTALDNVADRVEKGRSRFGVVRGEASPNARLTQPQVDEILRRFDDGERVSAIAADYPVSHVTISNITRGLRWAKSA